MTLNEQMDTMVEMGICTDEELQLLFAINGTSQETLDDIMYARTGYHDLEQFLNE